MLYKTKKLVYNNNIKKINSKKMKGGSRKLDIPSFTHNTRNISNRLIQLTHNDPPLFICIISFQLLSFPFVSFLVTTNNTAAAEHHSRQFPL